MNKLFISLFAAASAVALTACSSDEPVVNNPGGYHDGKVSFTVATPANFTRTVADGLSATQLNYAVFDADGNFLFQEEAAATFSNKQTTVDIPLVLGKSYKVAFFAKSETAPYTIANGVVSLDFTNAKANDDSFDAFYVMQPVTVSANMEQQSVILKRPFAQVNVGATDWATALKAGYEVNRTALSFTAETCTTFNLVDGTAENLQEVTYDLNALPDYTAGNPAKLIVAEKEYDHVAMAYVLPQPATESSLINTVTFTYVDPNGNKDTAVTSVPVQRNHRTNIIGRFFTTDVDYKIVIDEAFDDPDLIREVKAETAADFSDAFNSPAVSKIIVDTPLDLSNLDASDLSSSGVDKEIVMEEGGQLTLPATGEPFEMKGSNLTITGGTITNASSALTRSGEEMVKQSKSLIHIRDGVLTLKGVTLVNDMDHHWHSSQYNSSAISYWGNCVINIEDCDIRSGMFAVCGMGRGTNTSKVYLKNSSFESNSSVSNNGQHWAYCLRLFGTEGVLDNCTVKGIQGAVSTEEGTFTIKSGKYFTVNSDGKDDAFYALYATNASKVIIEGGDFYTPNKRTGLNIEGTSCVVSGDNDTGLPVGSFIEIKGGRFSGKAYVKNRICTEFNWVETKDNDNPLIKWTVGPVE